MSELPPRTVIAGVPPRDVPEWVRSCVRPSHLPPPDWKQIDAHLRAGVTSVTVNMDSRWSKVGPSAALYKPEVVAEADETMRRFVTRAHAAGVRALFYIGPVHVPHWIHEFRMAHPDWLQVDSDGRPRDLGSFHTGYGDWLVQQLAHLVHTYRVDGFWLDGYSGWHYSYDESSKALFRDHSGGREIPANLDLRDPVTRQYLLWFWQGYAEFADRMRAAIRAENPDAVLFANYSASREWYRAEHAIVEYPAPYANAVDVPSLEQYWDTPGDAVNQQFLAAFMEGVTHDRGASIWMQPQAFGTVGVSPEIEFRLRYLLGATRGVYAEFVEPAGREEYLPLWIRDMKSREEWMQGSERLPWAGIVASEQTRMTAGSPLIDYLSHPLGAFRSLMESHRPVGILTEYDLEEDDLQGMRVLVLPNVACLSDRAAEVIRRFVHGGGGLVATFETSLYDADGARRPDFALGDVFGAAYLGTLPVRSREEALALYVSSRHPMVDDPVVRQNQYNSWIPPDSPGYNRLALVASAVQARAAHDAEIPLRFLERMDPNRPRPAAIVRRVGKGRVVYFPAAVDRAMFFYPAPYQRRLLRNACDWAADSAPPVEVEAPLILATTFRTQPRQGRTIVHLLNDASSWGRHSLSQHLDPDGKGPGGGPPGPDLRATYPLREEAVPIHDVRVTCRRSGIRKATLQPEGVPLAIRRIPGGAEVVVPKIEVHSMVVFE